MSGSSISQVTIVKKGKSSKERSNDDEGVENLGTYNRNPASTNTLEVCCLS